MPIPVNHPHYLWLDSKTDYYPNPTAGLKSRAARKTTWRFQTDGLDYCVDVTITHADGPEETRHDARIKVTDFADEAGKTVKVDSNFVPVREGENPSTKAARWLADLHLMMYTGDIY